MHGLLAVVTLLPAAMILTAAAMAPEPSGRWGVSVDDYPAEALRDKAQGTTRFEVAVDADGKATACTVLKSSGHASLDQQACAVLMSRARFKPARDDAGNPVAGTWRHLVVWIPGNAASRSAGPAVAGTLGSQVVWIPGKAASGPAFAGHGVTVRFDGSGAVSSCKVVPLSASSQLTPAQAEKCRSMGQAAVFAALLDLPTQGLATATYRIRSETRWAGAPLRSNEPVQRVLAHIEIDRAADGAITWCEVKVAPAKPLPGFAGTDMCGPNAFGVSRPGGGGQPEHVIYDVVATR
jgi:TonB family protein